MAEIRFFVSAVALRWAGDDHSSGPCVAAWFSRPTRMHTHGWAEDLRLRASLFGLAPGGACRARFLTVAAVGSYSTVSPSPAPMAPKFAFRGQGAFGRLFSV